MSSSVSNRRNPVCRSKIFPTRDVPVPIKPIITIDLEQATSEYVSEGNSCKEDRDLIFGAHSKTALQHTSYTDSFPYSSFVSLNQIPLHWSLSSCAARRI